MANIKFRRTLQIGDRVEDLLRDFRTAQIARSASRGASVTAYVTADQTDVFSDFFIGDRPVLERSELNNSGASPIIPDDLLVGPEPAQALEFLRMSADNQSGAIAIVQVLIRIEEL